MLTSNALTNVNKLNLFLKCCHYVINVPFVKKKYIKLLKSLLADETLKTGLKWFDRLSWCKTCSHQDECLVQKCQNFRNFSFSERCSNLFFE